MPIRSHLKMALKSINSILDNVSDVNNIEILLRIDIDDDIILHNLHRFESLPNVKVTIGDKMRGWLDNHHFHKENCEISTGEFIQLWSDDLIMKTKDFDKIIQHKYSSKTCVVSWEDGTEWVCAPMISRNIYEITGAFGKQTFCDSYLCEIGSQCEIYYYDSNINVIHDRYDITGNNLHTEFRAQQKQYKSAIIEYRLQDTKELLKNDINLIKNYLKQ